jgi:hypothetical protein
MTVQFEDLPVDEMARLLDAKIASDERANPRQSGGDDAKPDGAFRQGRMDSDTVARARAQLAAAEAEARRRTQQPPDPVRGADPRDHPAGATPGWDARGPEPQFNEAKPEWQRAPDGQRTRLDMALAAALGALRELLLESQFRQTLRERALRHLSAEEPPEPQPWVALGLTRDVWARLKKAGKLKDD